MRALLILPFLLFPFFQETGPRARDITRAVATITAEDMDHRIGVMAHDSMGGRDTPSPGLEMTAAWGAREFEAMGLEPGGDNGSYIQRYSYTGRGGGAPSEVPNVVGFIRGSDPVLRDEWVVLTGHFDHVSGPADDQGDDIYNGADDNASGTAAIMEVAQAFAGFPSAPKRSMAFVLVSGEEKGLLGAAHFAQGASLDQDAMVANINADMVSRRATDSIFVHCGDYTTMGVDLERLVRAHPELNIALQPDPWPQVPLYRMSDQFAFIQEGIPGIFFFSGLNPVLHTPKDEIETIDIDKATRVARLIFYLGLDVAEADDAPQWTEAGLALLEEMGVTGR